VTPAEQIAYLRETYPPHNMTEVLAVCDLAERGLLDDDEREAVRRWLGGIVLTGDYLDNISAVMRRLLGE
jgi:hypothetical protein